MLGKDSDTMKALIIDRVSPLVESGLKEYGVDVDVKILPGVDELKRLLPEYDLLVMRVDPKIDRELLDAAAKRVKMIAVCSAGTNHIDLEYAKQLGIRIQNAPGINCNAVAELTLSKLLDVSRFTMEANREVQEDHIWNKYKYTGHELKGHTLGVIGLGKIGSRVAQLAQAFGMTVKAYDPYVDGAVMAEKGVEKVDSVLELCSRADYLTVHALDGGDTRHRGRQGAGGHEGRVHRGQLRPGRRGGRGGGPGRPGQRQAGGPEHGRAGQRAGGHRPGGQRRAEL